MIFIRMYNDFFSEECHLVGRSEAVTNRENSQEKVDTFCVSWQV